MRDTLENLYFGKITPNEQDITPGSVLADAMGRAEQCEYAGNRNTDFRGTGRNLCSARPWNQ